MSTQEIQRLSVDRGNTYLIYDRSLGRGPVYLHRTREGSYVVRLKSGQYDFSADETGRGEVAIDLVGGGILDGLVVSTVPDTLPPGVTDAIDVTLNISK